MNPHDRLQRRLKELKARLSIRSFEYRQRHGSKGVWLRIGRLLAGAEQIWAIGEDDAARLEEAGHVPEPPGLEIHPQLRIYRVADPDLLAALVKTPLAPRMNAALLQARFLVLRPF